MRFTPCPLRSIAGITGTTALLLAVPVAASAHVTITPDTVVAGGYATVSLKVPTESATASTTRVELDLPTQHPLSSVSYQQVPGWTAHVTTRKLAQPVKTPDGTITEAPTKVVWKATRAGGIKPGQFQLFPISIGTVPKVDKLSFVAKQTYSDGSVVSWSQPEKGTTEPEHPAPAVTVTATESDAGVAGQATHAAPGHADDDTSGNTAAVWFGVAGIAVGVLAVLLATYAVVRRR